MLSLLRIKCHFYSTVNEIPCKCCQNPLEQLGEFLIFPREILLVAKSYKFLALNIKSMIISALDTIGMRLNVPILALLTILGIFRAVSFGTNL